VVRRRSVRGFLEALETRGVWRAEREYEVDDGGVDRHSEAGGPWSYLGWIIYRKNVEGGFTVATLYGNQGAGKSVYSIKVARDVLLRLGQEADYKTIIKRYMVFLVTDVIRKIRSGSWRNRIPILIWDDAGVHGDAVLFRIDPLTAKYLSDVFRTARTRVAAVVMSSPDSDDILKRIRAGTDKYIVYIEEADSKWSIAHIYKVKKLPSGTLRIHKVAEEEFRRYLPVYEFYLEYRDRYVDEALDRLEERIQEKTLEMLAKRLRTLKAVQKAREQEVGNDIDDIDIEILPPREE